MYGYICCGLLAENFFFSKFKTKFPKSLLMFPPYHKLRMEEILDISCSYIGVTEVSNARGYYA